MSVVELRADGADHADRPERPVRPDSEPTLPRLLAGLTGGSSIPLARHRRQFPVPPLSAKPREDILAAVERSGLRGKGGAGFPTGRKLRAVAAGRGHRPIVVVNGSEGEPTSSKDKLLLARHPHLVLDGALAAAAAVGAPEVVVAVDRRAGGALRAVQRALTERRAAHERMVAVRVAAIPHRYVAGEETALVQWLNGGPAKPTATPPRPFEAGVDGRPTLVDNVETLAHVAQIGVRGPEWFRQYGTDAEPGTMLATVSGAVTKTGVQEVPLGARLSTVVRAAGGSVSPARCGGVLVGGYFGSWLTPAEARHARLSNSSLHPMGAALGCGAVVVLPPNACGLRETARILRWLAGESAGQCGSCVHGLAAMAGGSVDLFRGDDSVDQLHRWADQVEGRGACHFPNGAVRLLRSALHVFADDIERHRRGDACGGTSVLPIPDTSREPWQ